jgi:hypothetical protein
MAALAMRPVPHGLGAYFRHIAHRVGRDVAVLATARRLSQYIYRLLRWGQAYVDEGAAAYERRRREGSLQATGYHSNRTWLQAGFSRCLDSLRTTSHKTSRSAVSDHADYAEPSRWAEGEAC